MVSAPIAAPQFLQIPSCLCSWEWLYLPGFFCFFILHVELCMRQVVPFSPGQNGHWILFLLRKTCAECLRPTRSFLRLFFFSSHIPCQAFLFFFLPALPAFLSFESYCYTSKRNSTRKFPIVLNPSLYITTILRSYIV